VMFFNGYYRDGRYVVIHEKKGPKLNISKVSKIEGLDESGTYRFVKPIRPEKFSQSLWAERVYQSDRIEMYQTNFNDEASGLFDYREKHIYYTFDNRTVKYIDYKNLKTDIGDSPNSSEYLRAGRRIHFAQITMYTLGGAAIIYSLAQFANGETDPETGQSKAGEINVPAMAIGAGLINISFFLTPAKKRKYIKALESFK